MFLRSVFRTVPFHIFLLLHFVSIVFVSGHLEFTPVDFWVLVGRPHALTGSQDENSRSSNRIFGKNVSLRIGQNVFDGKIGQGVGVGSRLPYHVNVLRWIRECSFIRFVHFRRRRFMVAIDKITNRGSETMFRCDHFLCNFFLDMRTPVLSAVGPPRPCG